MRLTESASSAWIWRAVGCSGLVMLGMWALGLLLGTAFAPVRQLGQSATCQANVFRLARAQLIYADDYDEKLPVASNWMDRTMSYVVEERRLHCPTVSAQGERFYGYAMNPEMDGKARSKIDNPDETPLLYDSVRLEWSAVGLVTSLPVPGRHHTRARNGSPPKVGNYVGYAAGNARFKADGKMKSEQ